MDTYTIYDHISPSGKHYIGQTCQKPERRWGKNGSGYYKKENGRYTQKLFVNAIEKYGWDNFEHKILFTGLSKLDADLIEQDLIYYYKKEGLSYNITMGGEGSKKDRTQTKEEKAAKNRKWKEEHLEEVKALNRRWREEHKEEISAYNKLYRAEHRDEFNAQRREKHRLQKDN